MQVPKPWSGEVSFMPSDEFEQWSADLLDDAKEMDIALEEWPWIWTTTARVVAADTTPTPGFVNARIDMAGSAPFVRTLMPWRRLVTGFPRAAWNWLAEPYRRNRQ